MSVQNTHLSIILAGKRKKTDQDSASDGVFAIPDEW